MAAAILLLSCCALFASGGREQNDSGKLSVVASFYPMYDFASKIGGDLVEVYNLVPSGTEPHDWEPSTRDIVRLENADVLIYSGAGMEHWVSDVLSSLQNKELTVCEASDGVELISIDSHGSVDPHVWLDPENAIIELTNIAKAFSAADPENSAYYEAQLEKWAGEFKALDEEFKERLSAVSRRDFVVSHEAFGYLASAYDLEQVGIEGIEPDSEPDPARMAAIEDYVKNNNVKVIFSEELVSEKVASSIARATGAELLTINPLEGISEEELSAGADYLSVMRDNLDSLVYALE